jgi:hypothetical protein
MPFLSLVPVVLAACLSFQAQPSPTLKPGEKAPPLACTRWFTMLPTMQFDRGKVYVVLFWAHWQPESVQALGRICDMVHEKTGAEYIAVHDLDDKSSLEKVQAFCDGRRASLHCSTGFDELHATTKAWMGAAGRRELPTAFIVNRDGKVAYIGPAMWIDGPLKQVVSGDWDPAKAEPLIRELSDRRTAMLKNATPDGDAAAFLKDFDYFNTNYPMAVIDKHDVKVAALYRLGKASAAQDAAQALVHPLSVRRDAAQMVRVANTILHAPGDRSSDELSLAHHLASIADGIYESKSAETKQVIAEAWFAQGSAHFAAVEMRKAIELSTDAEQKSRMQSLLRTYEAAEAKQNNPTTTQPPRPPRRKP